MQRSNSFKNTTHFLWDGWCIASIIGIWPRFIEPRLISTTRLSLPVSGLVSGTQIKLIQLSDLHIHPSVSKFFLDKIVRKVKARNPDCICLTGDLIRQGRVDDPLRLRIFLEQLREIAPTFASLGNHDYSEYLMISENGDYTASNVTSTHIRHGFSRLLRPLLHPSRLVTPSAQNVVPHPELCQILEQSNITLLHNATCQITIGSNRCNITGLGEHMGGKCLPKQAYQNYDKSLPGITLLHNPDALSSLKETPGELVLCGHTHGGAVYLPWIWKKITIVENRARIRGKHQFNGKTAYISRGIGGTLHFRWFSMPEIVDITLESKS